MQSVQTSCFSILFKKCDIDLSTTIACPTDSQQVCQLHLPTYKVTQIPVSEVIFVIFRNHFLLVWNRKRMPILMKLKAVTFMQVVEILKSIKCINWYTMPIIYYAPWVLQLHLAICLAQSHLEHHRPKRPLQYDTSRSNWAHTFSQIAKLIEPTWDLSVPDGPHVGSMNLAIRDGQWNCMVSVQSFTSKTPRKVHVLIIVTWRWIIE